MSRLIDADKLHYHKVWIEKDQKFAVVVFAKEIDKAEIIDAVPVVRCGECMFYGKDAEFAKAMEIPLEEYCALNQTGFPRDGFCNYGRQNGGDE